MSKSIHCYRCQGWCYADDVFKAKTDIWCLFCGAWQFPKDFKPLPFVAHLEDTYDNNDWYIDSRGDIIDAIDHKIEELINKAPANSYNVSYVAKAVHCSNSEARMTLDRLVRNGEMELYRYGPQDRWLAYRKVGYVG